MDNNLLNEKLAKFGMRLEFWKVDELLNLVKKTKNPKKHYNKDIEALSKAISELGFKSVVSIDKDATEIGAGVGRILAAQKIGIEELPVFRILDLDKIKFKKFRIGDNRLPQLSNKWDEDILLEDMTDIVRSGQDIDWLYFEKFDRLLLPASPSMGEVQSPEFAPLVTPRVTPDSSPIPADHDQAQTPPETNEQGASVPGNQPIPPNPAIPQNVSEEEFAVDFSSSNEWGIPDLDPKFQTKVVHIPFVKWGEISYKKSMHGTWHFYVDDEKFENISDNPLKPLLSMPTDLVELNYSTYETQPAALAIGQVFFKRWVSRFWQSKGFNIIVDLNVQPQFSAMNLIGVPEGWRAYATRGSGTMSWLEHDWQVAQDRAGTDDILFVVYGGGQEVRNLAAERGWHFIPERLEVVKSTELAGVDGLEVRVPKANY